MNIKAVIFDYGNVISFPPEDHYYDDMAAVAGIDRDTMLRIAFEKRGMYDRGEVNGREFYRIVLEEIGIFLDDESLGRISSIDREGWSRINSGTVKLMEDVKASGLILGILSNMPHDFLAHARKNLPVFKLPDVAVFSCEAGVNKPEAAIYEALLSAAGCRAEELVFFDDLDVNINKARELGFNAFVWESPEKGREALRSLGVEPFSKR
ncbi:HAD family phosphatase [Treponema sp. OttesenSCG-928-L16]|nr:HAD family phosphatase [Treponema sp. OttesenSCG-928-L16]